MAKYQERIKARQLREQGASVKKIAKELKVAKSTASLWVRDIILSLEQLEKLKQSKIKGGEKGRFLGALKQKNDRLRRIQIGIEKGKKEFAMLTEREFFIAGISLYWAEGNKKTRCVGLCNSDPELVRFFIHWLKYFFSVQNKDLRCYVGINISHQERENEVKKYWSRITNIPLSQFRKTIFKRSKNKKVYENHNIHFGTFWVGMLKPARAYYKILGLIDGLKFSERNYLSLPG